MNEGDETRARGGCGGGDGARGQLAEARGAGAITLPKPLVALSYDRLTGTTIHRRFTPFNPLLPLPRVTHRPLIRPPPARGPARPRVSSPASSRRTLYGARIRPYSFVFSPCVRAYTKVCNFGVGNARYRTSGRSAYVARIRTRESCERGSPRRRKGRAGYGEARS